MFDIKKYILAFVITAVIFATALWISTTISDRKLAEVKQIEERISVDIASSETQFDLLSEVSCKDLDDTFLSQELSDLATKLSFMEINRPSDDPELLRLKKAYTLLEIKDYLLAQKVGEKCKREPFSILYFYSNTTACPDCQKEGIVLTHLRRTYPAVRVYAFDYDLSLGALQTLIRILKVKNEFPAIVTYDTVEYGYKDLETMEALLPQAIRDSISTTTPETISSESITTARGGGMNTSLEGMSC